MSVVSCKLMAGGCTLEQDHLWRRTVTETFLVTCGSSTDRAHTVLRDTVLSALPDRIPQMGAQYNFDAGISGTSDAYIYLLRKKITRLLHKDETDRRFWLVECTWGPYPEGYSGVETGTEYPLSEPVRVTGEWASHSLIADVDINGSAITNSAYDAIDPPVVKDDGRFVIVATKNMYPYNDILTMCRNYQNATNSDVFRGQPIGTCKMESITIGALTERGGQPHYPVTFRIHTSSMAGTGTGTGTSDTWQITRVNRGSQILEGTGTFTQKVWPKVASGTSRGEFLDMVNLNTDGQMLPASTAPQTRTFTVYPSRPFSALGIG